MRIDVLTLFPEMFEGVFQASILGKAREKSIIELNTVDFRQYAENKHGQVDDYPYGGGGGMILKPEPIFSAVEDAVRHLQEGERKPRIILMCPTGEPFKQQKAEELAKEKHLIFICGHYEGYDERIRKYLVTDELSIGDYVLTGGEIPAMAVIDSIVRLLPGVLGNELSAIGDSFSTGLLEYPQYTRPAEFRGWRVPDVLISGNHEKIAEWRKKESLRRTWLNRPDLLKNHEFSKKEEEWLREFAQSKKEMSKKS